MLRCGGFITGVLIVLATLGAVCAAYLIHGGAIFSPGGLHGQPREKHPQGGVHSHAELADRCSACHPRPFSGETMDSLCLACHFDVRRQIEQHHPLHGRIHGEIDCAHCHHEHQGPAGALTSFEHFDHNFAAFRLTGAHRSTACVKCHTNNVYKGTSQSCVSCHAEPSSHRGKFGTNCGQCHATDTWKGVGLKPEMLANFDHDRTAFKLTGAHRTTACAKCHANSVFKGTSQSCVSCHAEPPIHRGKFGVNCGQCHATDTWRGATVTHSFPLRHGGGGKEPKACNLCHTTAGDYRSYTCYGCHKHEPEKTAKKHKEVDLTAVRLEACAKCHPTGRKRATDRPKKEELGNLELDLPSLTYGELARFFSGQLGASR